MSYSRELLRLVTLPRGNDERPEQLCISLDEFEADDGNRHRYVSARVWFKGKDGAERPSPKAVTGRRREIAEVAAAPGKAAELVDDEDPAGANRVRELRQPLEYARPRKSDVSLSARPQAPLARHAASDETEVL